MVDCFQENFSAVAEFYIENKHERRLKKEFNEVECIDDIIEYVKGTDGDPAVGIPKIDGGWYYPRKGHEYWPSYLSLLRSKPPLGKGFPKKAVKSIDASTDRILNHIFDPEEGPGGRTSYGLVVGYVQSGKTANFTALLAKAADSGFDLFVVLSGMYNDLRQQTQMRLDRELVGDSTETDEPHVDGTGFTKRWNKVTNDSIDNGDIHQSGANLDIEQIRSDSPTLAVTKKQVDALDELVNWALSIPSAERGKINLMVIDDEADLASINTEANSNDEKKANAINEKLRTFLHLFDRRAYIGYTATPFANVFVNPHGDGVVTNIRGKEEKMQTLFPQQFIIALPKPDSYMGFDEIFPSEEAEKKIEPYREVGAAEAKTVRALLTNPLAPKTSEIPEELRNALREHLITHALRIIRKGSTDFSHTMLVHSTLKILNHKPLVDRIHQQLRLLSGSFRTTVRRQDRKKMLNEFKVYYEDNYIDKKKRKWYYRGQNGKKIDPPSWERVRENISWILKYKPPVVLNVSSDDDDGADLEYHLHPEGRNIIAVGGLRLSRGLTLEGLTVSYFLREAKEMKYDTVMQQGRWFGYRPGYDDLIRIFTTEALHGKLEEIGKVENDLREAIETYEDRGLSPMDFGVRVLVVLDMIPTEQRKMPDVRVSKATIEESIVPPWGEFAFDEPDLLKHNLQYASNFINDMGKPMKNEKKGSRSYLWKTKDVDSVVGFLKSLKHSSTHKPHFSQEFFEYIDRRISSGSGDLTKWSVGLISLMKENKKIGAKLGKHLKDFDCELKFIMPQRGRHAGKDTLGYFAASSDFALDLPGQTKDYHNDNDKFSLAKMWKERGPTNPFLAIYVFDPGYKPGGKKTEIFRTPEEKANAVPVVAVSVALPEANMTAQERKKMNDYWYNKYLPRKAPDREEE